MAKSLWFNSPSSPLWTASRYINLCGRVHATSSCIRIVWCDVQEIVKSLPLRPASGGVVAHFVGVQHVTLTCQLQNEDGSLRVTNWWKQTSQDRENGQERDFLLHDDRHFLLYIRSEHPNCIW